MAKQILNFPGREGQRIVVTALGRTEDIASYGTPLALAETLSVMGGRLNVIDGDLTNPSVGSVVNRSDGKTSFVLFDHVAATSATAILNGQSVEIDIEAQLQTWGFQDGLHYWLPLDADGDFVCEPGRRHRKWYVSRSATAKTRAQIAADAGVAEADVTGAWLDARPQYGATEATAIHLDAWSFWSKYVYGGGKVSRSDHIYFERGYDYTAWDITRSSLQAFSGEDELHPMLVTAYGVGSPPIVKGFYNFLPAPFAVFSRVDFDSAWPRYGFSIAIERSNIPISLQMSETAMCTVRETRMLTPWYETPVKGTETVTVGVYAGDVIWLANGNHLNGSYSALSEGLLMDGNNPHNAGYKDGYDYRARAEFPHPMTKYSHGYYFQGNSLGNFVRDNFVSSNSSCGLQIRTGVVAEGNILYDNNLAAGLNTGGRQYNIVLDNIVESMGYRRVAHSEGAFNWGLDVNGAGSVLVGNIVMHGANPDDPEEVSRKTLGWHDGVSTSAKLVDDTQVFDWATTRKNVEGLDPAVLSQTTIYRWVGTKLGKAVATKAEVFAHFQSSPSIAAAVREYRAWVKSRFGRPLPSAATPADLVFRPQTIMDGRRWDNRRNWSIERLPGGNVADTADLDGHYAHFGTVNADIAGLWSRGGSLQVSSGRLDIGSLMDAAAITTRYSGQVWIDGPSQPLRLELFGGRAVLGGIAANLDIVAGGGAQIMLGPDATVPAGKSLIVRGMRSKIGWDGSGTATATVAGSLEFRAGAEVLISTNSPTARRVYQWVGKTVTGSLSGATARIAAVDRWNDTVLRVWLDDLSGTPVVNDQFEVRHGFDGSFAPTQTLVTVTAVNAIGIGMLQRFRSGAIGDGLTEPTVAASLVLAAGSQVVITRRDLLAPGSYDLTGPGITVNDQGATLPAGVTVTGGKLVLTVPN